MGESAQYRLKDTSHPTAQPSCIRHASSDVCLLLEQVQQISFADLKMKPAILAELVCAIDAGLVSGKIGKQVLPLLLQVNTSTHKLLWASSFGMLLNADRICLPTSRISCLSSNNLPKRRKTHPSRLGFLVGAGKGWIEGFPGAEGHDSDI